MLSGTRGPAAPLLLCCPLSYMTVQAFSLPLLFFQLSRRFYSVQICVCSWPQLTFNSWCGPTTWTQAFIYNLAMSMNLFPLHLLQTHGFSNPRPCPGSLIFFFYISISWSFSIFLGSLQIDSLHRVISRYNMMHLHTNIYMHMCMLMCAHACACTGCVCMLWLPLLLKYQ